MRAILAAAALLPACIAPADPEVSRGAEEEEARRLVWDELLGADTAPPEVVWWYETCPSAPDDPRTAVVIGETCYSGLFRERMWRADVAWRGSYARSAYAHELLHAWQAARGIHDPDHRDPEWLEVPRIDAALADAGL